MSGQLALALFLGSWVGFAIWAATKKKWSGTISVGGGMVFACVALVAVASTVSTISRQGKSEPPSVATAGGVESEEVGYPSADAFKQRWNATHESPFLIEAWEANDYIASFGPLGVTYDPKNKSFMMNSIRGNSREPYSQEFVRQLPSFAKSMVPGATDSELRIVGDLPYESLSKDVARAYVRGVQFYCLNMLGACYAEPDVRAP